MKLFKPKFWDKKNNIFSIILLPLTFLVLIFIFLKKKLIKPKKFKIPIICIGNIYIGGTGKTPTSIFLANEISRLGKNPVILKKFYENQYDENNLIAANFKNFILKKNRLDGVQEAENQGFDIVILDDGFQDYWFEKDLNILCFNSDQLIGNGLVLPSGPLRESLDSLRKAHIILINGNKNLEFEKKIFKENNNLDIFYSYYKPINIDDFRNKKLLAIAGIGNPENFFKLLEENNLDLRDKIIFPDHHKFTKIEIKNILKKAKERDLHIIMTEKDFYKIEDFRSENLNYLKISLEIKNKTDFLKKLERLYV